MHVLIVTYYYAPEPIRLFTELAESLSRLGNTVTVLTGIPNWPTGTAYPGYEGTKRRRESDKGVLILRVPHLLDHSRHRIRRLLSYLSFAVAASWLRRHEIAPPDVIYMCPQPTNGVVAWILSRRWNVPFVCEIQDLWPDTLIATGVLCNPWALKLIGLYCDWVYRNASAIRVISEGMRRRLIDRGVETSKIHVVPNWVDVQAIGPVMRVPERGNGLGILGKFSVIFTGNIGTAQGLETVLEAANLLRLNVEIHFTIMGDGVALASLQDLARELRLENVTFTGRLPVENMPEVYAFADLLLVHLHSDPYLNCAVPHKMMHYLASGRPLLAAVDGDAAALVEASQSGVVCSPGRGAELADAVLHMYQMPKGERERFGENGRRYAVEHLSREELVGTISKMLSDALPSDAPKSACCRDVPTPDTKHRPV